MITAQPEFNLENLSEVLNNVSEFNMINTKWTGDDAYESALAFNEPAAVVIDMWHRVINSDDFTSSRMIALAKKNKGGLAGDNQPRRVYCSKEIATIIESKDFADEIEFIVAVMKFVSTDNPSITPWFVVRCLMPEIWKRELSKNVVLKNLKKKGFRKMDNTKMAGIKLRVNEILKMGNV